MKMYSDAFLNDSYLKYVGWTMHDKVNCPEQGSTTPQLCSLISPDQLWISSLLESVTAFLSTQQYWHFTVHIHHT